MKDYQSVLRDSVSAIVPKAHWVTVNEAKFETYLSELAQRNEQHSLDPTLSDVGDADDRIAFVLLRDTINFGSGWHPYLTKLPGLSGARTTGTMLARHFSKAGVPDANWLCEVRPEDCAKIFGQPMTMPVAKLMGLFSEAWQQLGRLVRDEYGGCYGDLVAAAHGSAVTLTKRLSEIDYFADIYRFDGLTFPFLKRAQLACYDLARSCPDDARCQFADLDRLTIFADNLVPHVLKIDGILSFAPELNARIEAGETLRPGSAEEIEIRASAVYATERLSELSASRGQAVIPLEISDWLWNRGQSKRYKDRPRPRIMTVHY